ncbi:MAG: hypothetical protein Ct9H300mP8_05730 [Gammaproteobacteria bacterium]|nr:MAG: hypothetical protein Ct9H300mP8_05730 [Gammaproteobacteria bacterium]
MEMERVKGLCLPVFGWADCANLPGQIDRLLKNVLGL